MITSSRRCFSLYRHHQQQQSHNPLRRSAYVARLRRAFLLRVHPDRFRALAPEVRKRNAEVVHAMNERIMAPDFVAYTTSDADAQDMTNTNHSSISQQQQQRQQGCFGTHKYVLEHKDGSILEHTIRLHDTVENVLKTMVAALESTGSVASMLSPPPAMPPPPSPKGPLCTHEQQRQDDVLWSHLYPHQQESTFRGGVNHKYDVNTHKGRDLSSFLRTMDFDLIKQRRASRMDVTAVALVARRAFAFLSIDGTGLGWSSASLAILLRSLVDLHEEHGTKFHVKSFYPLQLVWSSEEFEDPIDLYGGILYLNPASTPIQWLDAFLTITQDTLDTLAYNQTLLQENRSKLQSAFGGVRFQKGHSCSHGDYHEFISRLAESHGNAIAADGERLSTKALTLERIVVTVEASCRRAILTKDGKIRVGASMDGDAITRAISKFSLKATELVLAEDRRKQDCREAIDRVQWELGLQKVYHTKLVHSEQIVECLVRLLAMEQRDQLKQNLAANSLGIAGSGQFCHLGDDGSVVIPWDWR